MITMDVFKSDAFHATQMIAAVDKLGYVPGYLGSIPGLFEPVPVMTEAVYIEERSNAPALIQTSPRASAVPQIGGDKRTARPFATVRLAQGSRIMASELLGLRAMGEEQALETLIGRVNRRQLQLMRNMDLTFENLRLGCVQGTVLDADGSTIYNWATELGQTIPAEVDFDLDNANPASGALRKLVTAAKRSILRALKGLGGNAVRIYALCGDNFWDDLMAHPEIVAMFAATNEAQSLGRDVAFASFQFAGVTFVNYRGTDDTSTVSVGTDKAKFFPANAGIFQWAMSPGESFEHLGQDGQMFYSMMVPDERRNQFADVEVYSYPLPVCTMPSALYRAKRT
ncbi:MAG: major capsid protein [Rhodospirillaceae bacterium]